MARIRNSVNKTGICTIALLALAGKLMAIPETFDVTDILGEFYNMGGISLPDSPQEIKGKALQYCDSDTRISHIVTNRVYGDVCITFLFGHSSESSIECEEDIVDPDGVFAYTYNVDCPEYSELGYVVLEKRSDGYIHRKY